MRVLPKPKAWLLTALVAAMLAWMPISSFIIANAQEVANTAEAVTDTQIIDEALELVGMFGAGAWGYPLAIAIVAFAMHVLKWGRAHSIYETIPRQYRSFLPLGLGVSLGLLESLATGTALWPTAVVNGLAIGIGQHTLYEQVKGTSVGSFLELLMSWAPKFRPPSQTRPLPG